MILISVDIQLFRNFTPRQTIKIEPSVTGLVGKNESGKTTILKALHRLNPANQSEIKFNLINEYPRWKLAGDRRDNANIDDVCPVSATFQLTDADRDAIQSIKSVRVPADTTCEACRSYANKLSVDLVAPRKSIIEAALAESTLQKDDAEEISAHATLAEAKEHAKALQKRAKDAAEPGRARAISMFIAELTKLEFLDASANTDDELTPTLEGLLPKFFYFSSYNNLPGECNLTKLAAKLKRGDEITDSERTVISLLAQARATPQTFLGEDYEDRSAELQTVASDLSTRVFEYWTQNTDLSVSFNTDNQAVYNTDQQIVGTERTLKIELRDGRHGDITTNFSTRSAGFQWFFSFFAAFGEHQGSTHPVVVLLDEPGTSLHGEAQKDFLRFIYEELGTAQQTIYTTHSQFMIDPAKYENLRAVNDTATRNNKGGGVHVTDVSLSADRDTILPVESSLGYTISQHLFLGSGHHLVVEGSSDFVYLQRMSEYLESKGRTGLDPRLAIIPVGGADNMPAFVAILGRRLKVSALIDGASTSRTLDRVKRAAAANDVPASSIVTCASVDALLPGTADIEDLFHEEDYLRLYNWSREPQPAITGLHETPEPILRRISLTIGEFDHAVPAHMLTDRREAFFTSINGISLDRFENLFKRLNATLEKNF